MQRSELDDVMMKAHNMVIKYVKTQPGLENFTCFIKLDWSEYRTASRGGIYKAGPGTNYAMLRLEHAIKQGVFKEYNSFAKDKVIGTVYSKDRLIICLALCCHEMAHAVRAYIDNSNKEGHGPNWKSFYGQLRKIFVNSCASTVGETTTSKGRDNVTDTEKANFTKHAHIKGLDKDINIGTIRYDVIGDVPLEIKGWSVRARKYPVLVLNLKNNTIYKYPINYINNCTKKSIK